MARMLVLLTPVVYAYLIWLAMGGTMHERRLMKRIADVAFNVVLLSMFSRLVRCSVVSQFLYKRVRVRCHGYGALVLDLMAMIVERFQVSIL